MSGESYDWSACGPYVEEVIWHKAEGPLLDKKRDHYYFYAAIDEDGRTVDPRKKRAALLKDVIALANAARQRNKRAYLCLGIAEYDDWTIWGVEGKHPSQNPRPRWEEVHAHPDLMNQWAEGIARVYTGFLRQYVEPGLPEIHYETGWIEEHLIGLLVVRPTSSPITGFYLTEREQRESALRAMGLRPGWSWRRLGAINDEVEPHQREWMLKAGHEFPYIPLEGWRVYLVQPGASPLAVAPSI